MKNITALFIAVCVIECSSVLISAAVNNDSAIRSNGADGGEEFIGPLAGWDNIKSYGAAGDDSRDDTASIQNALNAWGTSGHSKVLFIPAGTYRINRTISAANKSGCQLLGADPATVTFKWCGAEGTNIFDFNSVTKTRMGRFTLDGSGTAGVGCWLWVSNGTANASSMEDAVFKNMRIGLRFCDHPGEVAGPPNYICDFPIDRCQFLNCTVAGINQNNPNTLNLPAEYCLFDHCGFGVTDDLAGTSGHGNIQVYNCVFRHSTIADAAFRPDASFSSFRGNYSIGSQMFASIAWNGRNGLGLTLQDNVILDPVDTPIRILCAGALSLIDNVIRYNGTVAQVGVGGAYSDDTISVGNTYCETSRTNPISSSGRVTRLDDLCVRASLITNTEPVLPPTPPNKNRFICELPATATGADIQNAIDSLHASHNGQRAVIHIPAGVHTVTNTITVPANSDVQLVGDGVFSSVLRWASAPAVHGSMLLKLTGPSRATVRDLLINANGNCDRGLVTDVADVPGDRVYMSQIGCDNFGPAVSTYRWSDILIHGQSNAIVDINTAELNYSGNAAYSNGVVVVAGPSVSVYGNTPVGSPFAGGRTIITGVNIGGYAVHNNAQLLVQDSWYEAHPIENPRFLNLTSSGTVTLQGNLIAPCNGPVTAGTPGIDINGFQGRFSLLSSFFNHCNTNAHSTTVVLAPNTGTNCNVLVMGSVGDDGSVNGQWFFNKSATANVGFLHNNFYTVGLGLTQNTNSGCADAAFLRTMLAQSRTQKRVAWPLKATPTGTSDVRYFRVFVINAISANMVIYRSGSGLPGIEPL